MGIARLLYGVNLWWEETNQNDIMQDTFSDWAYGVDTSFNSTYIRRCVSIYKYEADGTFSDIIKAQPIKFKQQIASHLDQGYSIDDEDWEKLVKRFKTGLKEMEELLDTSDLVAPIKGWEGVTIPQAIHIIAQHNAYHLGQIVTVRLALGDPPPKEKT